MALSGEEQELRERFFRLLVQATEPLLPGPDCSNWSIGMPESTMPLPPGPSHEMTLEALIDASQALKDHLQRELDKLRQEEAE
jgi:hypothetical protein